MNGWGRLWTSRGEAYGESAVLALLATANILLATYSHYWVPGSTAHWAELTLETLLLATMVIRRRFPLTFVVTACVAVIAALLWHEIVRGTPFPLSASTDLWIPILLSNAGVLLVVTNDRGPRWVAAWVLVAVTVLVSLRTWDFDWGVFTNGLALTASPVLFGLYLGVRGRLKAARRRLIEALQERAQRAEREQSLLAEQARAEERARLASEMHDVVSHRISLMVLQAGALRTVAPDEATRTAAEELRVSGSQALEELRDLVGVLRSGPPGNDGDEMARTATALPDLSTLAAESESVGIPVELVTEGNSTLTSPVVGRTAYQVVREALTNVRKHAPGAQVRVHVRYGADRLRVTVRNRRAPRTADPTLAQTGSGSGLYGLRQRVELVGGTLDTGPTSDGGFEVDAVLPAFVPTSTGRAVQTSGG